MKSSCKWYVCLASKYANFTALQTLPLVRVAHSDVFGQNSATVTLTNSSSNLAFLIRARVTNAGQEILPVFWSDNYISLLPGETRALTASFETGGLPTGSVVQLDGFNITPN